MSKFNRRLALLITGLMPLSSISNSMAMKNSEMDSLIHNDMPGVKCFSREHYNSAVLKKDKIYRLTNGLIVNPDLSCYHVDNDNEPHAIFDWDNDWKSSKGSEIPFHPLIEEVQKDECLGPVHEIYKLPLKDDENSYLIISYRGGKIKGITCDPQTGKTTWKDLNHENWNQSVQKFSNKMVENEIPTCNNSEVMSKVRELGIGNYSKNVLDYVPLKWVVLLGGGLLIEEAVRRGLTKTDQITQSSEQYEFDDI